MPRDEPEVTRNPNNRGLDLRLVYNIIFQRHTPENSMTEFAQPVERNQNARYLSVVGFQCENKISGKLCTRGVELQTEYTPPVFYTKLYVRNDIKQHSS